MFKKIFVSIIFVWLIFNFVSGEGCFHDYINPVSKAWVITRWANVRNVACMLWSEVIGTLSAGTKVRIIWESAWTEIVMPDGKVGWVWNNFITSSNDNSLVPAYPNAYNSQSYCDTTNLYRCPNPSPLNVAPTRYYLNDLPVWNTTTVTTNTTTTSTINNAMKTAIESLVWTLMDNLDKKIGDDSSAKKEFLEVLVNKISKTKVSTKVKSIIEYLLEQLENQITLLYIDSLID